MLELAQIAGEIAEAGKRERDRRDRQNRETSLAAEIAAQFDRESWEREKQRIREAKTSWLVAHAVDGLPGKGIPAPEPPGQHVVIATDGSQIVLDRHEGAGGVTLLNTGRVVLSYGTGLRSRLDSKAEILADSDEEGEGDALDDSDDGDGDDFALTSVGMRRFAREMRHMKAMIEETAATGLPALAFLDDPLVAFFLRKKPGTDSAQDEAFAALKETMQTARRLGLPIAGYVSEPRTRYTTRGFSISLCPDTPSVCTKCKLKEEEGPCYSIKNVLDADLFRLILQPGERSAIHTWEDKETGAPKILSRYRDEMDGEWVAFFYLHTGREIARVEVPKWVAEDADLVAQVHAICWDQTRKGGGYPVALAEAHEQAIVRGADRQAFLTLMQNALVRAGTPVSPSRKAVAKRMRAI